MAQAAVSRIFEIPRKQAWYNLARPASMIATSSLSIFGAHAQFGATAMTVQTDVTLVRGACPHDCPDTCGTITEVRDGRAIRFYADKEHPITQGWLCAKVRPYLERVYHPERLTHPLRRVG